jgi:hypothetical protein
MTLDDEAGTVKLGSGNVSTGLPQPTDANINRATAATTVLPPQPVVSTTSELTRRRPATSGFFRHLAPAPLKGALSENGGNNPPMVVIMMVITLRQS